MESAIQAPGQRHVLNMKLATKANGLLVLHLALGACSSESVERVIPSPAHENGDEAQSEEETEGAATATGGVQGMTSDAAPTDPTAQEGDPAAGYPPTGLSDPGQTYAPYQPDGTERVISRSKYYDQLQGFWLAQNIANWTGLITEFDKDGNPSTMPFYTDEDWGGPDQKNVWGGSDLSETIGWLVTDSPAPWGADDDTDIEYMYFHLLTQHETSLLTGEQIRDGWIEHIREAEENYLWVSNQTAFDLMNGQAMTPPQTSEPENNPNFMMIDAQLTTESFGLYSPARPDFALRMAHLPIRTTAKDDAEWISEFYVIMHSLASYVNPAIPIRDQVMWLADQARQRLPAGSYSAPMYDFIKAEYEANADKSDWESTRDKVYERYQVNSTDGYVFREGFDGGINFAASLVSLFYGQGDLKRTIQIGVLSGWDSDNPAATWGGLLGFMLGKAGVQEAFADVSTNLSDDYWIHRTRQNFPDLNGDSPGEDSIPLMAQRQLYVVDRAVMNELGGGVDLENDLWYIPDLGGALGD